MSIKNDWRACNQMVPFRRVVVGFDLRKNDTLKRIFLTSYNEMVRYEEFLEMHNDYLSAMNIFSCDPSIIPFINIPKNAEIIAFDLPVDYVDKLMQGGVSVPVLTPIDVVEKGWQFLGFDVVDPITQSSGLDGGLFASNLLSDGENKETLVLNKNGLINKSDVALKFSAALDLRIPEHMPFVPCGVWLKNPMI